MNAPLLDAKINSYKQKIATLSEMARTLPDTKRKKFAAEKRRYELRLEAWRRTLGSDLTAFNNNISEGYDELEACLLGEKNAQ